MGSILGAGMEVRYGPTLEVAEEIHAIKYRGKGESFVDAMTRVADALKDTTEHYYHFRDILLNQRFLPAGRVQAAMGSPRQTTPYNCYVSGTIEDNMNDIMDKAKEAAETMRKGGGIGYDFSTLRPNGALIRSLDSRSSGPVSFMGIYDSVCRTISSAGHRRGAQMGVLRVDHPDIEEFVNAKTNKHALTNFNISVGVTDDFMDAVKSGGSFDLVFDGVVYRTIDARALWNKILRNTWDWAEPGILFIDRINKKNNLHYIETIAATNPCLHEDTIVETVEGRKKIKDITYPVKVYTMLPDGSLGIRQASAAWKTKTNTKTVIVTVGSGKSLTCTPDHKIYVRGKGWVRADELKKGDLLVHLCRARRGNAYSGIKLSTEDNRAYRMEHRFMYEGLYGPISDNDDVHHLDGNTYNNTSSNLCNLSHSEHSTLTRKECSNDHQIKDELGQWVSNNSGYVKPIIEMPEHLRSNLKNQKSACVVSIKDGPNADVYDISVEETHNLVADFLVVHNCGEQPLPPYGACLLGSFNLVKYVHVDEIKLEHEGAYTFFFDYEQFKHDIPHVVRAMDNVVDRAIYPLPQQEAEAKNKRRMGLGVTGVANAIEALGHPYGSEGFLGELSRILTILRDSAYLSSVELALEKGPFPLFDVQLLESEFAKTLPDNIRGHISKYGLRNSHLLSVAPTGTISLTADNVSSGIEPVYAYTTRRKVNTPDGEKEYVYEDYGIRNFGVEGRTADSLSPFEHVAVLNLASSFVDSACSKTCNVGDDVSWDDFKDVYMKAYDGGASGCTTFRASGKRFGIMQAVIDEPTEEKVSPVDTDFVNETEEGEACYFDPNTGQRTCE